MDRKMMISNGEGVVLVKRGSKMVLSLAGCRVKKLQLMSFSNKEKLF